MLKAKKKELQNTHLYFQASSGVKRFESFKESSPPREYYPNGKEENCKSWEAPGMHLGPWTQEKPLWRGVEPRSPAHCLLWQAEIMTVRPSKMSSFEADWYGIWLMWIDMATRDWMARANGRTSGLQKWRSREPLRDRGAKACVIRFDNAVLQTDEVCSLAAANRQKM